MAQNLSLVSKPPLARPKVALLFVQRGIARKLHKVVNAKSIQFDYNMSMCVYSTHYV